MQDNIDITLSLFSFATHFIGLCQNLLHCIFYILPRSLYLLMQQQKNAIIVTISMITSTIKIISFCESFSEKQNIDMCS